MARVDGRGGATALAGVGAAALIAVASIGCAGGDARDDGPAPTPLRVGGGKIAFSSSRDGDFEIYVMNADGSGLHQLTRNAESNRSEARDEAPAFSPDGRLIAFTSTRDHAPGGSASSELYVMNADGSDQVRLTRNRLPELAPRWSPDGTKLVFVGCRDARSGSSCGLETMDADGGGRTPLTTHTTYETSPAWSPDGTKIAFARMEAQSHFQHFELYVLDLAGRTARRLTANDAGDGGPVWSPDGTRIAFFSNRAPSARCLFHDCGGYTSELYVMNADGTGVRRLTTSPHDDVAPDWSPDGRQLVFARILDEDDDYDLFVVDADGGQPRQLTRHPEWDLAPDWWAPTRVSE